MLKNGTLESMNWPVIESTKEINVTVNEKNLINFVSNDYLGLAQNNELKQRITDGILTHGLGATGSRRLSGNHRSFLEVEEKIAAWVGTEAAVLFNSGYQMNSSIFTVLTSKSTLVIADKYSHASLIDGIQSSDAQLVRFRHNDKHHLAQLLKKYAHKYSDILIVCESIYSMDGDTAPMRDIIQLKKEYNARVLVDEAHSIGLYGDNGNGWLNEHGWINDVDILLCPFGKAFGLSGAMLLASRAVVALIKSKCRGYIYSTALPIAVAIGIDAACTIIKSSTSLRIKLQQNIETFKSHIATSSSTQIQPVMIGDSKRAVQIEKILIDSGFFVRAVHHPTVPKGQSRLRITLTAHHNSDHITSLAHQIHRIEAVDNLRL